MLSADKRVLLTGFLGRLPEHIASRLAKAVEVDRLTGSALLPHDDILQALRPRLRDATHQTRVQTPLRLFCKPFEDLLVDGERPEKRKGRIARSSVMPVWAWLQEVLIPERIASLSSTIREAVVAGRTDEVEKNAALLRTETAAALEAGLARPDQALAHLGNHDAVQDAAEMALLLSAASDVAALQDSLPRRVTELDDGMISSLRDHFERWSGEKPDLAIYVTLIAMGRMEHPWEALRLARAISRQTTDTLISNTDAGAVGELLFADLEFHARKIRAASRPEFDLDTLLAHLSKFAGLSNHIVKELGIRRDGKWGQRLGKSRGIVAETMETLLERAPKELLAALPKQKMGGFNRGPKPLDLSHEPDPERVARATNYLRLVAESRPYASASAFNAKLAEVSDDVAEILRSASEDLLREVRALDAGNNATAEAHLAALYELSAVALGKEEADFLRRRSRLSLKA